MSTPAYRVSINSALRAFAISQFIIFGNAAAFAGAMGICNPPLECQDSAPQTPNNSDSVRRINELVDRFVRAGHFSGVVLVEVDGVRQIERAAGMSDRESGIQNQVDTPFCMASVTKSMTRSLAIRLLERREIGLRDPLSKYAPGFPHAEIITIENLMRHTSGIPHRVTTRDDERIAQTPESMTKLAWKSMENTETQIGTRLYSSAGYSVLAHVLEVAANKPFAELISEFVLAPSELRNTWDFEAKASRTRAKEYLLDTGEISIPAPQLDYSFMVGAGSMFATAGDVLKFGNAVLDGKLGDSVRLSLQDEEGVFEDNGSTNGYRCYFSINRPSKTAFVLMANMESGANDVLIKGIRDILAGGAEESPGIPMPTLLTNVNPDDLKKYCGVYKLPTGSSFEISTDGAVLVTGSHRLHAIAKDKFYSFSNYAEIEFVLDASGQVSGLNWVNIIEPAYCPRIGGS